MYWFYEQGIRGSMSMISNRYAKANNNISKLTPTSLGANYDPSKKSTYVQNLDANNLYGASMREPLPTKDFRWLTEDEVEDLELNAEAFVPFPQRVGYILEADLDYPKKFHFLHNDYPLAPEHLTLDDMSEPVPNSKAKGISKLIPNHYHKEKYILNYTTLFYLRHGLKVRKIHRGIRYTETDFLRRCIEFKTEKRTQAVSDFEKDFHKLMNNAPYGKSFENVRNRQALG